MTEMQGTAHSVHTRLVARSKELHIEAQLLLERYALHRLLYRLSKSQHADRFLLKGAQLILIWIGESARTTRDADLLGFGDLSDDSLRETFTNLCSVTVEPDGLMYLANTLRIAPIREENAYGGRRIHIQARLGNARLQLQIDVGIGDAVTPEPVWVELPQMLDLPAPRMRAYRPETSIAEKLETIVARDLLNSRLKDYFDIYVLSMNERFELPVLSMAVQNTFERRDTSLPSEVPMGLTQAFVDEPGKPLQWQSFLNKVGVTDVPDDLAVIVQSVAAFLVPVLDAITNEPDSVMNWPPGGQWQSMEDN